MKFRLLSKRQSSEIRSNSEADSAMALGQGDRARDMENWSEAVLCYSEYLENNPNDGPIWVQLGNCSKEAGQYDRAMQAYQRALEIMPDSSDLHLQIGHFHNLRRNFPLAIQSYRKALALDPSKSDAVHELKHLEEFSSKLSFIDFETFLDDQKLTDLPRLLELSKKANKNNDPFQTYSKFLLK